MKSTTKISVSIEGLVCIKIAKPQPTVGSINFNDKNGDKGTVVKTRKKSYRILVLVIVIVIK